MWNLVKRWFGSGARCGSSHCGSVRSEIEVSRVRVDFEFYAPDATSVSVAGDFNSWDPNALQLNRTAQGTWHVEVPLPAGTHEYRYVVDGRWCNDQRAVDCVPNSFGGYNNVVSI